MRIIPIIIALCMISLFACNGEGEEKTQVPGDSLNLDNPKADSAEIDNTRVIQDTIPMK